MIVLDTTILAYAAGGEHPLREPCRRLLSAVAEGTVRATTTIEVIQEFAHVRARRRPRADAVALARDYAQALTPLLVVDRPVLERGLSLFEETAEVGCFDAILAAAAIANDAQALVSVDTGFGAVPGLNHVDPATEAFERLIAA